MMVLLQRYSDYWEAEKRHTKFDIWKQLARLIIHNLWTYSMLNISQMFMTIAWTHSHRRWQISCNQTMNNDLLYAHLLLLRQYRFFCIYSFLFVIFVYLQFLKTVNTVFFCENDIFTVFKNSKYCFFLWKWHIYSF